MNSFEFYFSFYGLLLGLSVAQVAAGIGHAVVVRKDCRIGWLTPLLSLFILLDIASFWVWAWRMREDVAVGYASIFIGLAVAFAYFLATVLLFPVRDQDWRDLDAHYWANRRLVVLGIVSAALVNAAVTYATSGLSFTPIGWLFFGAYWVPLLLMLVIKRKAVDGVCLVLLIADYIGLAISGVN